MSHEDHPTHAGPKPRAANVRRAAGDTRNDLNDSAADGSDVLVTTAAATVAVMLTPSGIATVSVRAAAATASVKYTTPASTSPNATFATTAFAFSSDVTGVTASPADDSTRSASRPHGTFSAQSATFTFESARSARSAMPAGLPFGTMIAIRLVATATWGSIAPDVRSGSSADSSATATTSTGAPCWIWVTSDDDAPKLAETRTPGWAFSNSPMTSPMASVSDDAADTTISRGGRSDCCSPHPIAAITTATTITEWKTCMRPDVIVVTVVSP